MSPTALTLRYLRRLGFMADVAERWIAQAGIRRDLFHCIDVVAIKTGEKILGVQCTSLSNLPARVSKARQSAEMAVWLGTGHARFQLFGWTHGPRGWEAKIGELQADEMKRV